ncbi:MAG: hypothetical protein K0U39_02870, partial [Alphaproteobacteria bacterium]|nr:hypothetical protein [Alphaproteobacteria bacterium]
MLIALYSCGGTNNGSGSSSDDVNVADNVGPPSANTTINPPSYEGRFSFGEENYEVAAGGEVEIIINLTKGDNALAAPKGGLNIILEESVNGTISVPAVRPVVTMPEGDVIAIFTYSAAGREAGDVVTYSFNFDAVESDDGETKYGKKQPRTATISIETNDVSFISGGNIVTVGQSAEGEIILSAVAKQQITVPVNILEILPGIGSKLSVENFVFEQGEDRKSFSYQAATSSAGGYVTYSLPAAEDMPVGLQAGEYETFTFVIQTDPDLEGVFANFGVTEYLMNQGQSVDIDVRLTSNEDLTDPIIVNVEYRNLSGGGWQSLPITFPVDADSGKTEKRAFITYSGADGDREYRLNATNIGGDTKVGSPASAVVSVISGEIGFKKATQDANNGQSVDITVELAAEAVQAIDVIVDIASTQTGGAALSEEQPLSFKIGEKSKTFTYITSGKERDSTITFSLKLPLPPGIIVTSAGNKTHIVQLRTDTVTFVQAAYSGIKQGVVLDIPLTTTKEPAAEAFLVPLSVTHKRGGQIISTNSNASAIFAKGGKDGIYKLDTSNYAIDDVVEVRLDNRLSVTTGLEEGAIAATIVDITHRNTVSFSQDYLRLGAGKNANFQLELGEVATESVPIKITRVETPQGGAPLSSVPETISFGVGEKSVPIEYDGTLAVLGTEIVYSITERPNGIGIGEHETLTVEFSDTSINFAEKVYEVRAGSSVDITAIVSSPFSVDSDDIPINIALFNADDTVAISGSGKFNILATKDRGSYEFEALPGSAGQYVKVFFGNSLPHGLETDANGIAETRINILSSDVNFTAATYDVRLGGKVDVMVEIASPETSDLEIPYQIDGVDAGDFTIKAGETLGKLPLLYHADQANHNVGDTKTLTLGTLPAGLTQGDVASSILSVKDNRVQFASDKYAVAADGSIDVYIQLASPAIGAKSKIPLSLTINGAETLAEETVIFDNGQQAKSISFDATALAGGTVAEFSFDTAHADWREDMAIAPPLTATVTVNDLVVEFDENLTFDLLSGDQFNIPVKITGVRSNNVNIPILAVEKDSGNNVTKASYIFASVDFPKTADNILIRNATTNTPYVATEGSTVEFTFGTLPDGVSAGTKSQIDATIREIKADFKQNPYTVRGGASVDVYVELSHPAIHSSGSITVPVVGTAYLTDSNTVPISENVEFNNGVQSFPFSYKADPINNVAVDYVDLGFATTGFTVGVSAGTTIATTRIDVQDSSINFVKPSEELRKGSSLDIQVELTTAADGEYIVPYTINGNSDPSQIITFRATDTSKIKTITHQSTIADVNNATFTYGFGTLPEGVSLGSQPITTITIIDSSVNFDAPINGPNHIVREGGKVQPGISLVKSVGEELKIPVKVRTVTLAPNASDVTIDGIITVPANIRQHTFEYDAAGVSAGTTITYTFNTPLPSDDTTIVKADGITVVDGVTAGVTKTTTITVTDSAVNFKQLTDTVPDTDPITVEVKLESDAVGPPNPMEIPIEYTTDGGLTYTDDVIEVAVGDDEGVYEYTGPVLVAGTEIDFRFGDLTTVADLKAGSGHQTSKVTVTSNKISFGEQNIPIYPNGTATVTIDIPDGAVTETIVPYKRTITPAGGTPGTPDYLNVTFDPGDVSKPLPDYTAPANSEGVTVKYEFDTNDFDLNGIGNGVWPGSKVTIDVAKNTSTIEVKDGSIKFEAPPAIVRVGDIVTIKVLLEDPAIGSGADNDISIPIIAVGDPNAPANVKIVDGDSDGSFDYTASGVGTVTYTFGSTLPSGLTAVAPTSSTFTVTTADIDFDTGAYDVREGTSVNVVLSLPDAAIGATSVPIKFTTDNGVTYTYDDVLFNDGDISAPYSYLADANGAGTIVKFEFDDNDNDDATNGNWPSGITVGTTHDFTEVTVLDSSIKFAPNSYDVRPNDTEEILFELEEPAIDTVTIPIIADVAGIIITDAAVNGNPITEVEITNGNKAGSFFYTASTNATINFSFGTLPAGVKPNTVVALNTATVSVVDGAINFDSAHPTTVRVGNKVTIEIKLLSPVVTATDIPIKIIKNGDTVNPSYLNVEIAAGGSDGSFEYDASSDNATDSIKFEFDDDSDGNSGAHLDIYTNNPIEPWPAVGFNVGSAKPDATVTVLDPSVDFAKATDQIAVASTKAVELVLAAPAAGEVTDETIVPIRYTKDGGANYDYVNITFNGGDTTASHSFSDATLVGGDIVEFSLDNGGVGNTNGELDVVTSDPIEPWPSGVEAGTTQITSTITVVSGDMSFVDADKTKTDAIYRVNHDATIDVNVALTDTTFNGSETIPLKVTRTLCEGTATPAVSYSDVTVNFTNGEGTFTYNPATDNDPYNTKLTFEFDKDDDGVGGAAWNQTFGVDGTKDEVTACVTATIGFSTDVSLQHLSETVHTSTIDLDVTPTADLPVTLKVSIQPDVGAAFDGTDVPSTIIAPQTTALVEQGVFATYGAGNELTYSFDKDAANWPKWLAVKQVSNADDVLIVGLNKIEVDFVDATQPIYRDASATITVKAPVTWVLPLNASKHKIVVEATPTMIDNTQGTATPITVELDGITGEGTFVYEATDANVKEVNYIFLPADADWSDDFVAGNTQITSKVIVHDRGISFDAPATQTIVAGDTANISVTLASPAIGAIEVPVLITGAKNGVDLTDDYQVISFADGDTTKPLTPYVAPADANGTDLTYQFDTANAGNINAPPHPAWPTDTDKDNATIDKLDPLGQITSIIYVRNPTVNFDTPEAHIVRQGGTVGLTVNLNTNASNAITLPIKITNDVDSTIDYAEVEILSGTDTGTLNVTIDKTETANKVFTYAFDTDSDGNKIVPVNPLDPVIAAWPTGTSVGTSTPPKPPTTITVRDSGVAFDTASVNVRAGSDAEYKIV